MTTAQLRGHDPGHGIMHYVRLRAHRRHIYVMYVHDLPSNQHQRTHAWRPCTNYGNLPVEEVKASVNRAEEINNLATLREAYHPPMLEALIEA